VVIRLSMGKVLVMVRVVSAFVLVA
jgi:hypothetical protein